MRIAIGAAIGVAYFVLAHLTTTVPGYEWLGVALGVGTFYAVTLAFAWPTRLRIPLLGAGLLAGLLIAQNWSALEVNFPWFYLLEHAGTNLMLGGVFGATLLHKQVPLCTRIAQIVHSEELPGSVARYTRQVTLAWTVFFLANASVSIALFLFAPLTVWSTYANILTAPLVALVFLVEYAIRVRTMPAEFHSTIVASIAAFWLRQYGSANRPSVPFH